MVVLGAGPGGYTAAFRAADLGRRHRADRALRKPGRRLPQRRLHPVQGAAARGRGDRPGRARRLRRRVSARRRSTWTSCAAYKDKVVGQLTKGLSGMAKQRKVRVVQGGREIRVAERARNRRRRRQEAGAALRQLHHRRRLAGGEAAVVPVGRPARDGFHRRACNLADVPKRCWSSAAASSAWRWPRCTRAGQRGHGGRVHGPADAGRRPRPGQAAGDGLEEAGRFGPPQDQGRQVEAGKKGIRSAFEGESSARTAARYDRVLVAVGRAERQASSAPKAGVAVTDRGFIPVDKQMRTNVPHIFAIGDVVGSRCWRTRPRTRASWRPKSRPARRSEWVARVIPSVAYTDPEIAWVGVTETEAKAQGPEGRHGQVPVGGVRARHRHGRTEGFTKLVFDEDTTASSAPASSACTRATDREDRAGDRDGRRGRDIGLTIHPHPTPERIGGHGGARCTRARALITDLLYFCGSATVPREVSAC
jgi:dihydrolipoamide dehydrogenase